MSNAIIGERLRRIRGSKTRKEVAEAVGISVSAIQMYENGARVPRDETKKKMADYYKTSVGALFFDEEARETCGS